MTLPNTDWRLASLTQIRGLVAERNQLARDNARLQTVADRAQRLHATVNQFFLGDCDKATVIRAQSLRCSHRRPPADAFHCADFTPHPVPHASPCDWIAENDGHLPHRQCARCAYNTERLPAETALLP